MISERGLLRRRLHAIMGLIMTAGCASTAAGSNWSIASIDEARGQYDFRRVCRGPRCALIVERGDDPFEIDLDDRCAASEGEICVWRDGVIQLFIPTVASTNWRFYDQEYRLKEQAGQRRLIEQFKNGKFYAAYLIDSEAGSVTYVILEDEICLPMNTDTLRCYTIDHGNYLVFNLKL